MQEIVVASGNPVKRNAALIGFQKMFPEQHFQVDGIPMPSGVADQPMTCDETYLGAINRMEGARRARPDAHYWVGIEGGLEERRGELVSFAWIVIRSPQRFGKARTGSFFLAPAVADLVRSGLEMGHADDQVFGRTNSKQTSGATGILTDQVIDRTLYYEHAVILALIPFNKPDYYPPAI